MTDTEQFRSTLEQLPLAERLQLLETLESSVATEYEHRAEQALREGICVVEQRLAEFASNQIESMSWDEIRKQIFGHS